ncbi:hypothetical protein M5689_024813 [Euphorbia peplus]|nr:hypothetical protein M5689_024813 [Euphorbia peplus]
MKRKGNFTIRLHHGGRVVIEGNELNYFGGVIYDETGIDEDTLSRINLLWIVKELGYDSCGSLCYRNGKSGDILVLLDDIDVLTMVNCKGKEGFVEVFIDKTVDAKDNGTHIDNNVTVDMVANMVINTIPIAHEVVNERVETFHPDLYPTLHPNLHPTLGSDNGDEEFQVSAQSNGESETDSSQDLDEDNVLVSVGPIKNRIT